MVAARVRMVLATLWVGSLWTIGYIVAPTLFGALDDRTLAGAIAGKLFRIEAWLSVVCAIALIFLIKWPQNGRDINTKTDKHLVWIVLGMLACTVIGYFGLQPFISALRESAADSMMDAEARSRFGLLHGISSVFYLAESLLGGLLVWKLR